MLVIIAQHKFLLSKLCQVFHNNLLVVKILGLLMNLTNVNRRIMTTIMSKILFDSNSFGFDQSQPQQYTVNHPIFNAHNSYLDSQIQLNSTLAKITEQMTSITYDDDDDEERFDSLDENIISGLPPFSAITPDEPVLSNEEPDNSLSMGDEHLDTISATESDEFINSSVENLILIPSESEGIPDHMCDVPSIDNYPPLDVLKDQIKDFCESNEEFSSTDDDSLSFDNIEYVEASPPDSELVSSEVMEIVIPEVDAFLDVKDEFTSSQFPTSYLDPEGDMLLFEEFLDDDHSSDFKTKSASTSLNSLLEETNNFNNSLPEFTTFPNVLCDAEYESNSSDNQSCSDKDVLDTIISKPLCEKEIIPMKSLRTHDSSLLISSKINCKTHMKNTINLKFLQV
nr:hypothetical protein [Tanacetum cinerariifolium]